MAGTPPNLHAYVGKNIANICPHKYVGQNNCAHFEIGTLCNLTTKKESGRATIRVNELFNSLARRGLWKDRQKGLPLLLVFVTSAKHVKGGLMTDHPQKHIGIWSADKIFNYSNSHHRVMVDSIESFHAKFDDAYDGNDITLYYGVV